MSDNKKEQIIDMSARSKLRIRPANQYELEQNRKSFKELNESIENDIKMYNEQLDTYIADLQKKETKTERQIEKLREIVSVVCGTIHIN